MSPRAALLAAPLLLACASRGVDTRPVETQPTSAALPVRKPAAPKLRDVRVAADPSREARKLVRVRAGDAVALTLPETAGTVWAVAEAPPELGSPAEDVEARSAAGREYGVTFTWPPIDAPPGRYPVTLVVKSEPESAARGAFELTFEVEPGQMR